MTATPADDDPRLNRLRAAVDELEAAMGDCPPDPEHPEFAWVPDDLRWRLHVCASSIRDMTFWVRKHPDGGYEATEVEIGASAYASSAEDAIHAYFNGGPYAHPARAAQAAVG